MVNQIVGIEFNSATKSKETRNKILDERTFWYEKSLIPTFGRPTYTEVNQKYGLNFHKLSHARMFSRFKILFLVSLLFVALLNSIPTYLLNFYHST